MLKFWESIFYLPSQVLVVIRSLILVQILPEFDIFLVDGIKVPLFWFLDRDA